MPKKHPEYDLQKQCVEWLRENSFYCFSVPNEACFKRVNYFKGIGMLPGAADLLIIGLEQVIFVEFKSEKGRLSTEQRKFKSKVEDLGHTYIVIRHINELKRFFGFSIYD